MDNLKKVGLTALAGSLAMASANAAEMTVSGASVLTYTSEDGTEVTGNPFGMKTNLSFKASGDVNGYTVSYMQTSVDQFAGMSSARLTVDMGDMGVLAFDQGSGSGLANIDDMTPTAAEEIWDGLDTTTSGRVGAAGSSGVFNYVKTISGVKIDVAARKGSGTKNSDGSSSGVGQGAYDVALTTDGSLIGVDGLAMGAGYGKAEVQVPTGLANAGDEGDKEDVTAFVKYTYGPMTIGYQESAEDAGGNGGTNEYAQRWGIAFNVNDNLSISYGEAETEFAKASTAHVTEDIEGFAVAYTMGSMKIAGNMNDGSNMAGSSGSNDEMTEIALSFAF